MVLTLADGRHLLADLDVGRLVVQRHDLRPLEDFDAMVFGQRAEQQADVFAGGREHEAAVAELAVLPADGRSSTGPARRRRSAFEVAPWRCCPADRRC